MARLDEEAAEAERSAEHARAEHYQADEHARGGSTFKGTTRSARAVEREHAAAEKAKKAHRTTAEVEAGASSLLREEDHKSNRDRSRYLYYTKTQLGEMLDRDRATLATRNTKLKEKRSKLVSTTSSLTSKTDELKEAKVGTFLWGGGGKFLNLNALQP